MVGVSKAYSYSRQTLIVNFIYSTNQILIRGGSARRSNPLPFYIPFWQKGTPFIYILLKKGTPFTYLLQEVLFSFSCSA